MLQGNSVFLALARREATKGGIIPMAGQ